MGITIVSSREFNQDVSRAKRAAVNGPVFITDRGHPSHVLLTSEEYQKLTDKKESIVELLAMPDTVNLFSTPLIGNQQHKNFSSSSGNQKPVAYFEPIRAFFALRRHHLWI